MGVIPCVPAQYEPLHAVVEDYYETGGFLFGSFAIRKWYSRSILLSVLNLEFRAYTNLQSFCLGPVILDQLSNR